MKSMGNKFNHFYRFFGAIMTELGNWIALLIKISQAVIC